MVQTYQSPVRIYKHAFEIVMAAYEKRFPTCPQIPIFVGSEIVHEYESPDRAEWTVERKCQLNVEAPYIVKKLAGVDYVYFTQKNSLDRRHRRLEIEASNISFSQRLVVIEKCTYYVHPENSEWTCFEQSASLDVKSFFGFEATVEKLAVKQYGANLAKGKEILEGFIADLLQSGVTYIEPWHEPENSEGSAPNQASSEAGADKADRRKSSSLPRNLQPHQERLAADLGTASSEIPDVDSTRSPADSAIDVDKPDGDDDSAVVPPPIKPKRSLTTDGRRKSLGHRAPGVGEQQGASVDEPDAKLEADYIRRFLGELSQLEESRLCELKYSLQEKHKGKLPNDAHLLRFLRARDFDVAKARDMVSTSLLWRKQHNVDAILHDFEVISTACGNLVIQVPAVLAQYVPGCWHHSDRQDRPLFVLRLGLLDIKGILRSVGLENIVKFTLTMCEEGLNKAAAATKQLGKPISSWTLLIDLDGLSMRHLWRPGVQCLRRIIEIVEAHYPETLGQVLIVRAPRVFPILWTLISPFIDENTRKKFIIHGGESCFSDLVPFIAEQHVPDFLGGTALCQTGPGGHVPKKLYRAVDSTEADSAMNDVLQSTYTTGVVSKGQPVEVVVPVKDPGSVLTWDFDVIKLCTEFTGKSLLFFRFKSDSVYYTSRTLATDSSPPPAGGSSGPHSPGPSSSILPLLHVDPSLTGDDLTVKEKTTLFNEGDSMQGSVYCSRTGTYILQWRVPAQSVPESTSGGAFDFVVGGLLAAAPKSKLMYYYELLDSANFRGSVASLESCRSSFSSLTVGNTNGNGVATAPHQRQSSDRD